MLDDADDTRAGSAAAVRRGERLVQVDVHDVDARFAGAHLAEQGVQVGAVHVDEAARFVHDIRDLAELLLEQAERGRVGDHDGGDVVLDGRRIASLTVSTSKQPVGAGLEPHRLEAH